VDQGGRAVGKAGEPGVQAGSASIGPIGEVSARTLPVSAAAVTADAGLPASYHGGAMPVKNPSHWYLPPVAGRHMQDITRSFASMIARNDSVALEQTETVWIYQWSVPKSSIMIFIHASATLSNRGSVPDTQAQLPSEPKVGS
jgi:hypothetical protein